jgi:L-fucose isomerase-like protein
MRTVTLISNGDFRDSVGVECWPKQVETLKKVEAAFRSVGVRTRRAHPYIKEKKHGFITTQAEGCRVFAGLVPSAPVVIVLSSWVWASHVASSLTRHKGPILLIGNFDGTWPGLVALLNHSATLERMGTAHAKLWTDSFAGDALFAKRLKEWLDTGRIEYPTDHVSSLGELSVPQGPRRFGKWLADDILKRKRILGQMDPGCMGMLNAVMSPEKLAGIGMPVELLNQSDLLAEMSLVEDATARRHYEWLKDRGTTFHLGTDPAKDLTGSQVIEQMKMYTAAGVICKRYGLAAIGIPYQYGLVRCTSVSDLPEGMLNNSDRPDILDPESGAVVNRGRPVVHFNEGDLGSAVPQVLMHDILTRKKMPPETTLHDVRWGDTWEGKFVWVLEISGGGPPAHWGGWKNTHVYRQPAMYFPKGGGTCSGVSKPGVITWARFYERFGSIGMDMGTGETVSLPAAETKRRLQATTKEWPIANVHIPGYDRDRLMSTHRSNHITVCYGDILRELAAVADDLGIPVNVIGDARKGLERSSGLGSGKAPRSGA